eukprot:TRINITY_DN956_c0_g1_i1.p1 TRINITY_DN956_c0_g1~~TRINITY_DN956_c0_g1_i1.p1  ORF type:complete len:1272 (+),score=386.50 TRINITY_DN956_c0_g1_i1:45-3860(+)
MFSALSLNLKLSPPASHLKWLPSLSTHLPNQSGLLYGERGLSGVFCRSYVINSHLLLAKGSMKPKSRSPPFNTKPSNKTHFPSKSNPSKGDPPRRGEWTKDREPRARGQEGAREWPRRADSPKGSREEERESSSSLFKRIVSGSPSSPPESPQRLSKQIERYKQFPSDAQKSPQGPPPGAPEADSNPFLPNPNKPKPPPPKARPFDPSRYSSGDPSSRYSSRGDTPKAPSRYGSSGDEANKPNQRHESSPSRFSSREETRKPSQRSDSTRYSAREDTRRPPQRSDSPRYSPREETRRPPQWNDSPRFSREETKRPAQRNDSDRFPSREETGRPFQRNDSSRFSSREDGKPSQRDGSARFSSREESRRPPQRSDSDRFSSREESRRPPQRSDSSHFSREETRRPAQRTDSARFPSREETRRPAQRTDSARFPSREETRRPAQRNDSSRFSSREDSKASQRNDSFKGDTRKGPQRYDQKSSREARGTLRNHNSPPPLSTEDNRKSSQRDETSPSPLSTEDNRKSSQRDETSPSRFSSIEESRKSLQPNEPSAEETQKAPQQNSPSPSLKKTSKKSPKGLKKTKLGTNKGLKSSSFKGKKEGKPEEIIPIEEEEDWDEDEDIRVDLDDLEKLDLDEMGDINDDIDHKKPKKKLKGKKVLKKKLKKIDKDKNKKLELAAAQPDTFEESSYELELDVNEIPATPDTTNGTATVTPVQQIKPRDEEVVTTEEERDEDNSDEKGLNSEDKDEEEEDALGKAESVSLQKEKIIKEMISRMENSNIQISDEFWPDREVNLGKEFPNIKTDVDHEEQPRKKKDSGRMPMPKWLDKLVAVDQLEVEQKIEIKQTNELSWDELGISDSGILSVIKEELKFEKPTKIQVLAIPEILRGTNVFCAAQTGTGKTLAYLLPLLDILKEQERKPLFKRRGQRSRSILLVPTRELVEQALRVISKFLKLENFKHWRVYGMAGGLTTPNREDASINPGLDILISTPEKLELHYEKKHISFDDTIMLVIDEADTIVNNELFFKQMKRIVDHLLLTKRDDVSIARNHSHQILWVSATVSKPIAEFIHNEFPETLQVFTDDVHKCAENVDQNFVFGVGENWKNEKLLKTLKKHKGERTLIFCNQAETAKSVHKLLLKKGYSVGVMVGGVNYNKREKHFAKFNDGDLRILISTDLASRGIDTNVMVEHVVLYDFPNTVINYLHRIGRTGRAGAKGRVTAFVGTHDQAFAKRIRDSLNEDKSLESIVTTMPKIIKKKKSQKQPIHPKYLNTKPKQ